MKVTELHLRNIASIERADIDFSKDLCDRVTGDPASVFLIGGDTGAGKSVILDGISMALYKTTPRIDNVANKKLNSFRSEVGEDVGINSIEQYTRMGIGPDDECYSEVAFEDEDGNEYHARLTLGMYLTRKTAAHDRRMEHRSPVWEYKKGREDWIKDNSGSAIQAAIGLTFDQFCRMAMLAQGKFESFLTGDKTQREIVLEQLTNTEKFSDYGKAINQIFKETEEAKKVQDGLLNNEANKPLETPQVEALTLSKADAEKQKAGIEAEVVKTEGRKTAVMTVRENDATIAQKSAVKAEIEAEMKAEAYVAAKSFVSEWDKTDKERHALTELHAAQKGVSDCSVKERTYAEKFTLLCADINARIEVLARQEADLTEASKASEEAKILVDAKQKEIDLLVAQRDKLNPTAINAELGKVASQKADLGKLSQSVELLAENGKEAAKQKDAIAAENEKIEPSQKAAEEATEVYGRAKEEYEAASSRFSTMNASVDEAIVSLRHKLQVGETCPLCGQHVDMILLEDDFKQALSPLEKEQKEKKDAMDKAEVVKNVAATALINLNAAIKAMEKAYAVLQNKMATQEDGIKTLASKCGLDVSGDLAAQIAAALASLESNEAALKEKQTRAEELQKQINAGMAAKKPLDQAFTAADKKADQSKNAVSLLSGLISDIKAMKKEMADAHESWTADTDRSELLNVPDIRAAWSAFNAAVAQNASARSIHEAKIAECEPVLAAYYAASGKEENDLLALINGAAAVEGYRKHIKDIEDRYNQCVTIISQAEGKIAEVFASSKFKSREELPALEEILENLGKLNESRDAVTKEIADIDALLKANEEKDKAYGKIKADYEAASKLYDKWSLLNKYFGGTRFRTLVQSHILKPLLNNANIYLEKITDRYVLTCSEDNEQLSILVQDNYLKQLRSSTVLSGGEKFMISLALSLALSSLNRPDMNVNILFIDEGFGTLDKDSLESVMTTLESLKDIAGQSKRRVGIISHREELEERIPVQIQVTKKGQGRSAVDFHYLDK